MNSRRPYLVYAVLLSFMCASLIGCQPFRKKFVRKKKEDRAEKFIPVLDPIEYPAKVYSVEDQYKHSYSLWKVWSSDFVQALVENENDKKQKYNLAQSLKALEDMKNNVNAENQTKLNDLMTKVSAMNGEYDKAVNMRSIYQMKSSFEKIMSQVRNELSPRIMTDKYAQ